MATPPAPSKPHTGGEEWKDSWKAVLGDKYVIKDSMGRGVYGSVVHACSRPVPDQPSKHYAIKRMERMFGKRGQDAKVAYREIRILSPQQDRPQLDHPNIIRLYDVNLSTIRTLEDGYRLLEKEEASLKDEIEQAADGDAREPVNVLKRRLPHPPRLPGDLYLTFEYMDTDLEKIIQSPQAQAKLSMEDKNHILYQILAGIKYLHSANVIHRDLKPANILITHNPPYAIKIADFGLSRVFQEAPGTPPHNHNSLTRHVVTRWYRAPEVILSQRYSGAVDVWSIGCIYGELLDFKPLFPGGQCGELSPNRQDGRRQQLDMIFDVIGTPAPADFEHLDQEIRDYISTHRPRDNATRLNARYSAAGEASIELLGKMLAFSPDDRISVEDCLGHPTLNAVRDEANETVCEHPMVLSDIDVGKELFANVIREVMLYRGD